MATAYLLPLYLSEVDPSHPRLLEQWLQEGEADELVEGAVLVVPQLAALASWGLPLQAPGCAAHSGRSAEPAQGQIRGCGVAARPKRSRRCCGLHHLGRGRCHADGGPAGTKYPCSQQPMRPPTAPEAHPLAQGKPLRPRGAPSPSPRRVHAEERLRRRSGACAKSLMSPPSAI